MYVLIRRRDMVNVHTVPASWSSGWTTLDHTYTSSRQELGQVTVTYLAVAIGGRSQGAKMYFEKHFESFADGTVSPRLPFVTIILPKSVSFVPELNVFAAVWKI
jgi:hypothetical protein